jgi:DNA-binding transcriptional MerR regulator
MPDNYSMSELAKLTGLRPRTIRYYVAEGLVPSPGREGAATRYPESTRVRLRLIAKLRDAHQPLAQIRSRLAELTDDEVVDLSAAPVEPAVSESALDYIRGVLEQRPTLMAEEPSAFYGSAARLFDAAAPSAAEPLMPAPRGGPAVEARFRQARFMSSPPARGLAAASALTPAPAERSNWDRIVLADGIELHVRQPLNRRDDRLVERLVALARQPQKEDQP